MRNSEKKITMGIDLYFSNLSSRKVRNHFRRHIEHNVSHETILKWCRKYVLKVQKYVDTLKPELSGQLYVDETDIPRGCNTKKKGGDQKKNFCWFYAHNLTQRVIFMSASLKKPR